MRLSVSNRNVWSLLSLAFLFLSAGMFAQTVFSEEAADEDQILVTADLLLPQSTCAYVSIRDIDALRESWKKTALGQLQERRDMEAFFKSIEEQIALRFSSVEDMLGLTLHDVCEIASSEVSGALLQLDAERYGFAVVINVGDKRYETQAVLSKIAKQVAGNGGSHQKNKVRDAEIHILNIAAKDGSRHKAYYVLTGELLLISDKPEIVKDILTRLNTLTNRPGEALNSFSEMESYLEILGNTIIDDQLPDIIWYCDPMRYAQVARQIRIKNDPEHAKSKDYARLCANAGFDGLEALGGVITFRHGNYDATQRIFLSIPNEPKGALKMLSFDPNGDKNLPSWIPEDCGQVQIYNLNVLDVFDNLGPLVNQFFGEGGDSVWEDVLDGFKNDPYGPKIDLREDIISLLENKVVYAVHNRDAKALDGERRLIAIPVKDADTLQKNLASLLNEEPSFETLENDGDIRWKYVNEGQNEGRDASSKVQGNRFPEMTITVWNGYLLIASEPDFIDFFMNAEQTKAASLSELPVYKKIIDELTAMAGEEKILSLRFVNNAKAREHTYEMIKAGTLLESAATYSSVFGNLARKKEDDKNGKFKIDTSEMPEFNEIREYFLPSGGYLFKTKGGYVFQGILTSKEK